MNLAESDSYWHDSTRGWIHIRLKQTEDRTEGGTIVERDGNEPDQSLWQTYQYADDRGWNLNSPECVTPLRSNEWCSEEFRNDQEPITTFSKLRTQHFTTRYNYKVNYKVSF